MMPLQVKGLMESTMVHALRALREDYDLLLSTMDIFIKEPSVDWLVSRKIISMVCCLNVDVWVNILLFRW